jgi:SAM-dependent methyltransferase
VTSFDVLYSLHDDDERAALREMYRLLRPGGYAIINVAAMEMLRGNHSVLTREVRRYSRDVLRNHVTDAGFTVVRLTYAFATLFAPLAVLRAWQRHRGLVREDDARAQNEISVPAAPVNTLLAGALRLEAAWLRRFDVPFGSSLLCVARKPTAPRT